MSPNRKLNITKRVAGILFGMLFVLFAGASIYTYNTSEKKVVTNIEEACPVCPAFSETTVAEVDYTQTYTYAALAAAMLISWAVFYGIQWLVMRRNKP